MRRGSGGLAGRLLSRRGAVEWAGKATRKGASSRAHLSGRGLLEKWEGSFQRGSLELAEEEVDPLSENCQ